MDWMNDLFVWMASLRSYPAHVIALTVAPLFVMAIWRKAYPSGTFVLWAILPSLLTIGVLFKRDLLPLILAMDAAILVIAMYDGFCMPRVKQFEVTRECQRVASLKKAHRVQLTLVNQADRAVHVCVRMKRQEFATSPAEFELILPASQPHDRA